MEHKPEVLTVTELERIPWLVHGFGKASFGEGDLPAGAGKCFKPVILRQIHSNIVHHVKKQPEVRPVGDALVTAEPGLLLVVRTADCLPVFLIDEFNLAVAVVHCGWRGTQKKVLVETIRTMQEKFSTQAANLLAALGPAIRPCCYEVGPEVKIAFQTAGFPPEVFAPHSARSDKFCLDLAVANRWLLTSAGLSPSNIFSAGDCTCCRPDYISYRRDRYERRRLYNFIGRVLTP